MTAPAVHNFQSAKYWQDRYQQGGTSGSGSYGRLCVYKANFVNEFVHRHGVQSVVELGCGDGNQASMFAIQKYTGLDVSQTAVVQCRHMFADKMTWAFHPVDKFRFRQGHEMSMSLDVIYHLVEDEVFDKYMKNLFQAATKYVLIYASDHDDASGHQHVRHREYSSWIASNAKEWEALETFEQPFLRNETSNPRHTALAFFRLYGLKNA